MGDNFKYPHFHTSEQLNWDNSYWMSELPDDMPLSLLSIPGSYRTCSWKAHRDNKRQSFNPNLALKSGIRAFDVELKMEDPEIFRLLYEDTEIEDFFMSVLNDFVNFLMFSKRETILCCLTSHLADGQDYKDTLWNYILSRVGYFLWSKREAPKKLGEARGKIIFFLNYEKDNSKFCSFSGINAFPRESSLKWPLINPEIERLLLEVVYGKALDLQITWSCCVAFTQYVNSSMLQLIKSKLRKPCRLGIVFLSFPGEELIQTIIECNFKSNEETGLDCRLAVVSTAEVQNLENNLRQGSINQKRRETEDRLAP